MGLYQSGLLAHAGGDVDPVNDTIRVLLVDTTLYTQDLANNTVESDIPEAAVVASDVLGNVSLDQTAVSGELGVTVRADAITLNNVTGTVGMAVFVKDTGIPAANPLLASNVQTGWPTDYDDDSVPLDFDPGDNGIYRLSYTLP